MDTFEDSASCFSSNLRKILTRLTSLHLRPLRILRLEVGLDCPSAHHLPSAHRGLVASWAGCSSHLRDSVAFSFDLWKIFSFNLNFIIENA